MILACVNNIGVSTGPLIFIALRFEEAPLKIITIYEIMKRR